MSGMPPKPAPTCLPNWVVRPGRPVASRPNRARIDQAQALKKQLMGELACWIEEHQLKQAEAAQILNVTRPRVSDVVNKKAAKFTIDALAGMLARVGKPVRVVAE